MKSVKKHIKNFVQAWFSPEFVRRLYHLYNKVFPKYPTLDDVYEPEVSLAIRRLVRPGWRCVDVGANIGRITILFAQLVGKTGRVVAFEAHPDNVKMLKRTIRYNGFQKIVRVENIAVADGSSDSLLLYPGRGHSEAEWSILEYDHNGKKHSPELSIPAVSLDGYFNNSEKINFVKIDIEGAEDRALIGMRRILSNQRPIVLVEFHNETGWRGRSVFFESGYMLYAIDGKKIDSRFDAEPVYHCIAFPSELADVIWHE